MTFNSQAHPSGPENRTVRLLVATENRMNCQLLISALQRGRAMRVVGWATTLDELMGQVATARPNVALVTANLRDGASIGFAVVRELRSSNPEIRVILLLDSLEQSMVIDAFRAGAKGIFFRGDPLKSLSKCVQRVHAGQIWANSSQLEIVLGAFCRVVSSSILESNRSIVLSKREKEVATLVAAGFSNREISRQLNLSEHTIKNYLFHVFEKLGISSRVELVLYAREREGNDSHLLPFNGDIEPEGQADPT